MPDGSSLCYADPAVHCCNAGAVCAYLFPRFSGRIKYFQWSKINAEAKKCGPYRLKKHMEFCSQQQCV